MQFTPKKFTEWELQWELRFFRNQPIHTPFILNSLPILFLYRRFNYLKYETEYAVDLLILKRDTICSKAKNAFLLERSSRRSSVFSVQCYKPSPFLIVYMNAPSTSFFDPFKTLWRPELVLIYFYSI